MVEIPVLSPVGGILPDEHGAITDSRSGLVDGYDHGFYSPFSPAAIVAWVTSNRSAVGPVLTCCQRRDCRTSLRYGQADNANNKRFSA
jgi:hypothetical protein